MILDHPQHRWKSDHDICLSRPLVMPRCQLCMTVKTDSYDRAARLEVHGKSSGAFVRFQKERLRQSRYPACPHQPSHQNSAGPCLCFIYCVLQFFMFLIIVCRPSPCTTNACNHLLSVLDCSKHYRGQFLPFRAKSHEARISEKSSSALG